mmetsp:Transcript_26964/g.85362  ORF Transcript_26964/g.85362 Transcript_26964/m.85362 type:complete len:210 (-) Transcript_26964:800-1429(-)
MAKRRGRGRRLGQPVVARRPALGGACHGRERCGRPVAFRTAAQGGAGRGRVGGNQRARSCLRAEARGRPPRGRARSGRVLGLEPRRCGCAAPWPRIRFRQCSRGRGNAGAPSSGGGGRCCLAAQTREHGVEDHDQGSPGDQDKPSQRGSPGKVQGFRELVGSQSVEPLRPEHPGLGAPGGSHAPDSRGHILLRSHHVCPARGVAAHPAS